MEQNPHYLSIKTMGLRLGEVSWQHILTHLAYWLKEGPFFWPALSHLEEVVIILELRRPVLAEKVRSLRKRDLGLELGRLR